MSRILKCNVTLCEDTGSFPRTFLAGEELPEKLVHLVGKHVFGGKPKAKKPVQSEKPKAETKPTPKTAQKDTVPSESGSKASWVAFAKKKGVSIPDDAGRNDIIEIVYTRFPELRD